MADEYVTRLSTHDERSVTVRGKDLTTEIMGEMDFAGAFVHLLIGKSTTKEERRLVNSMLCSLMVHGTTPHAIATRMTILSEPESTQGAVASGLLGVGGRFAGAMEQCAQELETIASAEDQESAVRELVATYRDEGRRFPGIGHPEFDPVDPRAKRLFELADVADVTGEHVAGLKAVREEFERTTGSEIPINVTGAIGALTADLGLEPEAARGFAIVSRAAGLLAEIIEEKDSPIAMDIWQSIDNQFDYEED